MYNPQLWEATLFVDYESTTKNLWVQKLVSEQTILNQINDQC